LPAEINKYTTTTKVLRIVLSTDAFHFLTVHGVRVKAFKLLEALKDGDTSLTEV
jgi:hypothetical protein